MLMRVDESFLIYESPPGDPMGYLCEPRMTRLVSGDILLSFRSGTTRFSADGNPHFLRSGDVGRTWEDLGRPLESLLPDRPGWDYRAASPTQLASGAVLASVVGLDRTTDGRPLWLAYNPDPTAYQGMIPIRNLLARSDDGGQTWSAPWTMSGLTVPNSSAQMMVTLADGDILCSLETFKHFDEPGPWRYRVDVIRSHDGGRTWGESAPAHMSDAEGDPRELMCWDPRMALLPDGTLIQYYYAFLNRTGGEERVHVGWSRDGGRTWALPCATSLEGQATFPIALTDELVIGLCQRRKGVQGIVAVVSADGGRSFVAGSETKVYEHIAASAPGFSPGKDPVGYMNEMIHFTFGHPTGVSIGKERALAVWYAGNEERTGIFGATVSLVPSG
jgi:hypothetical protein